MTINGFIAYVKQLWKNKPDTSTPLSADRLTHLENGIKGNSDAIEKLAAAVINQITNDPNKIASMAALCSVKQALDTTNNNLGNLVAGSPIISDCNSDFKIRGTSIVRWNSETLNTPYKFGISPAAEGTIIEAGLPQFRTQISIGYSAEVLFIRRYASGAGWNDWNKIPTTADILSTIQYYATGNSDKWINIPYPSGYNKDNCYVSITYTGTAANDMVVFKINENTGQFCYTEIKGSNFGINARFIFFRK